ncbi:nucleotide exchange factor GrpE [Ferrovibrio sp.]|uniref:nucleotide exchange factor GrpE n=1 Tax=Ferrovibrio sp. TaxID=1917215 RepID=UPI0025BFE0C3|nr:nucleotide exchange factor GrpE [Ferrovibrio sp.]MBX3455202.1 nucleotide exchange factor GrpE [Ferrovibrio sp.]
MNTQPQATPTDAQTFSDAALNTEAATQNQAGEAEILRAENAELKDKLLRMAADTENLRRRLERERDDATKFAAGKFAKDILSVADNLRRALENAPKAEGNEAISGLTTGIEATERELLGVFERHGIQRIDPQGEKFDPNLHQAMFEVENPNLAAGTVIQVVACGYVQHGRLLRAAMVGVSKGGPATAQPSGSEPGAAVNTQA